MGFETSDKRINLYRLSSVIILAIAFFFHLIAIADPHWASSDLSRTDRAEHIGLWKYCTYPFGGGEICYDFVDIIYGDWLKAAQSFMILSLFVLPMALGLTAMCTFVKPFEEDTRFIGASLGVTALAGLLTLTCVCSFGDRFQEYFNNKEPLWAKEGNIGVLDWAFGLCVTDMLLTFLALGLNIAGM